MAKTAKEQREEMKTIDARLDKQDRLLDEILLCLKGSENLNIEGVIPAQKRLEKKFDREIDAIHQWQAGLQKYFDVLSSKGFKRFIALILFGFIGMYLYMKFGAAALVKFLTWLFS